MTLPAYEQAGGGPDVVLVHAGIADRRMWEPQWRSFPDAFRVLRLDLHGFGDSPLPDGPVCHGAALLQVLDAARVERAALVGASLGGRVALEVAIGAPGRVSALVLVGAGLPDHEPSPDLEAFGAAEWDAWEAGDLDRATELNVRFWLDRPGRATPPAADVVALVARMQRRAFELAGAGEDLEEAPFLAGSLGDRLGEVRPPTLVVVGDEDVPDFRGIAGRLAAQIPNATLARIAGAAHLPSLEQPAAFDAAVRPFLERVLA